MDKALLAARMTLIAVSAGLEAIYKNAGPDEKHYVRVSTEYLETLRTDAMSAARVIDQLMQEEDGNDGG